MMIYYVININDKVCPKNQSRAGATGGDQIMSGLWAHMRTLAFAQDSRGQRWSLEDLSGGQERTLA